MATLGATLNTTTFPSPDIVGGRLTLVSATSLKWAFVNSNQILLYNGSAWVVVLVAAEKTAANTAVDLNGSALAVSKIYDVFAIYSSATDFTLGFSRWQVSTAGASTRCAAYGAGTAYAIGDRVTSGGHDYVCIQAGTGQTPSSSPTYWTDNGVSVTGDFSGLYVQDGILVSSSSTAGKGMRWLGVIYTFNNSATVNFKDDTNNAYIGNYYNPQNKTVFCRNTTASWTYQSDVIRESNGGTGQVRGNVVLPTTRQTNAFYPKPPGGAQGAGIGIDSVTAYYNVSSMIVQVSVVPLAAGFHYLTTLEHTNNDPGGTMLGTASPATAALLTFQN